MAIWRVQSQCSASNTMVKKKRRKYGLSTHSFNCTRFPFPTSIVFKKKRNRRLSGSQSRNHLHPLPGINLKQPFSKRVPLPGTEWSTTGIAYSASCTRVVKYPPATGHAKYDTYEGTVQECLLLRKPLWPTTYKFCSIKIAAICNSEAPTKICWIKTWSWNLFHWKSWVCMDHFFNTDIRICP